jgi:holo-[acyl-carrier protein] synthase
MRGPPPWQAETVIAGMGVDIAAKALGAPAGLRWTDAEMLRHASGRPFLTVRGTVAAAARAQGVGGWHLSLSHDGGLCVAMVIAESAAAGGGKQQTGHDERCERGPA